MGGVQPAVAHGREVVARAGGTAGVHPLVDVVGGVRGSLRAACPPDREFWPRARPSRLRAGVRLRQRRCSADAHRDADTATAGTLAAAPRIPGRPDRTRARTPPSKRGKAGHAGARGRHRQSESSGPLEPMAAAGRDEASRSRACARARARAEFPSVASTCPVPLAVRFRQKERDSSRSGQAGSSSAAAREMHKLRRFRRYNGGTQPIGSSLLGVVP